MFDARHRMPFFFVCVFACLFGSCGHDRFVPVPPLDVSDSPDSGLKVICPTCSGFTCFSDDDCNGGHCIMTETGSECRPPCDNGCAAFERCEESTNAEGAWVEICVNPYEKACLPCKEEQECVHSTSHVVQNHCLETDAGQGSFCHMECAYDSDCQASEVCKEVRKGNDTYHVCAPRTGECLCSESAVAAHAETACHNANTFGTCEGIRTCMLVNEAPTSCNAAVPSSDICNEADDDCDGSVDEDFPLKNTVCDGADADFCEQGRWICGSNGALACNDDTASQEETCNGLDDDCNQSTDDGLTAPAASLTQGVCLGALKMCRGTEGWQDPDFTSIAGFEAIETTCDGKDNNCNGATDDGLTPVASSKQLGVCAGSVKECRGTAGWQDPNFAGVAGYESNEAACDGRDNDCDGATDETLTAPLANNQLGLCSGARKVCGGSAGWQEPVYASIPGYTNPETMCDGIDSDCDGVADDNLSAPLGSNQNGVCRGAQRLCGGTFGWLEPAYSQRVGYEAVETTCDGLDNDCDTFTDESLTAPPASKQAGVCAGLRKTCGGTNGWQEPNYSAVLGARYEVVETLCDGLDNDCDGLVDNNLSRPLNPNQNGACAGSRQTCRGSSGWANDYSTVPGFGLPETPDQNFIDENCDGIDGDVTRATFVAGTGSDNGTCTLANPCRTLNFAMQKAMDRQLPHVYVQAGSYIEGMNIPTNLLVFGGYNLSWVRAPHTVTGHKASITYDIRSGSSTFSAVTAVGVTASLFDLELIGPNATGTLASGEGRSSHVVYANNSTLTIDRCTLQQGRGADGAHGADGANADASRAPAGGAGGPGARFAASCNNTSRGAAGVSVVNLQCASSATTASGAGGAGGTMDTRCGFFNGNDSATAGLSGSNAAFASGSIGAAGGGGGVCGNGGFGQVGTFLNGLAAGNTTRGGKIVGEFWAANNGLNGALGTDGTGGGGGGGEGGCDTGTDSYGAGGGGGGAGGCRAPSAAQGGKGGGGSFGVYAVRSNITVRNTVFKRARGGNGGNGGNGGRGQSGGLGGAGGTGTDGRAGGTGGNGAHGGHGGGAGGGAGGFSCGIVLVTPTAALSTSHNEYFEGAEGSGGLGGIAAPFAPAEERDGFNGPAGPAGWVGNTLVCTNTNACQPATF